MIVSFKGKLASDIYDGINSKASRKLPIRLHQRARDLLDSLDATFYLIDLKIPSGNRLHQLKGNLKEYYSLSINNKWRIIFKFYRGNAFEVEVIDYHK